MTKRQIINYYGQKYDNVKHIKGYINALCERYKNELKTNNKMKTNTKQYLKNISIEIFNGIEDFEGSTKKEKLQTMVKRFNQEYNYKNNKLRWPNLQLRFSHWLQGLALNLPYNWYDVRKLAQRLHETDNLTEKQYLKIEENYWNHMAFHCLKLARKYNIDLDFLY